MEPEQCPIVCRALTINIAFYLNGNETPVSDQDVNASHTNKRDEITKRRNKIAYKIYQGLSPKGSLVYKTSCVPLPIRNQPRGEIAQAVAVLLFQLMRSYFIVTTRQGGDDSVFGCHEGDKSACISTSWIAKDCVKYMQMLVHCQRDLE